MTACSTFLSIYCGRLVHVSDHGQMIWISDEEMLQRPLLEVKKALQWYTNSLLMHAAMDHPMFEKSMMRYVKLEEIYIYHDLEMLVATLRDIDSSTNQREGRENSSLKNIYPSNDLPDTKH
jgi:hypothetical protein